MALLLGTLGVATRRRWLRLTGTCLGLALMAAVAIFAGVSADVGYAAG